MRDCGASAGRWRLTVGMCKSSDKATRIGVQDTVESLLDVNPIDDVTGVE